MPVVKKLLQHRLVFDTHTFLWYAQGSDQLSSTFCAAAQKIEEKEPILISPMSLWEIGMLCEKKRLSLGMDTLAWVEKVFNCPSFQLSPLVPEIAILSTRLPEEAHGDPVDRILMATAIHNNAVLVTADQKILHYGTSRFLSVYDPT